MMYIFLNVSFQCKKKYLIDTIFDYLKSWNGLKNIYSEFLKKNWDKNIIYKNYLHNNYGLQKLF